MTEAQAKEALGKIVMRLEAIDKRLENLAAMTIPAAKIHLEIAQEIRFIRYELSGKGDR